MKTLEFIYQETQIHFLVNPNNENVMVNATEMAKLFGKETRVFLKTAHAKAFIKVAEQALNNARSEAEQAPNGARSDVKLIDNRGHMGIYFNKRLALKFAAWLSPEFEYWIYSTIDEILFGHYKEHWNAHLVQEKAKLRMAELEQQLYINPTAALFKEYKDCEKTIASANNQKKRAIANQYKLF